MKKTIIFTMMLVVGLCAAATDRLYIEDYFLELGDTCTVSILLDNETAYTAFQTDLYLPEGLSVAKEDDDYAFELTSRKSSDHIIMGQDRPNGSIRIMSYSMQVNPYSGNSGALVTFSVIASDDFTGGAVELKNTLFTTLDEQEISFANETCQIAPLKDLTGEIVFEYGGNKTSAWEEGSGIIDIYDFLYISYSGEEDVDFSILVNGYDLLNDEDLSGCAFWDEQNKRYEVALLFLQEKGVGADGYYFSADLIFDVTVHACDYNDLSSSKYAFTAYVPPGSPSISEYDMTGLSYLIQIGYDCSVHFCDCPGYQTNKDDETDGCPIYAIERLDHDYTITVFAANRTPKSRVYSYTEKTFLIPAREGGITISKSTNSEVGEYYGIVENGTCDFYTEATDTLGSGFAIIESDVWSCYSGSKLSVSFDDQLVFEYDLGSFSGGDLFAINLLPFGDIYGGEHHVEVTANDGFYSLSADTVLEIHPVQSKITSNDLILDVASDMNDLLLRVDGQEVELSTNGQEYYYALERLDNDYSVKVQAGVTMQNEYYGPLEFWTIETTIVIPAKDTSSLIGDVNGDGEVNVSDVTSLISKVLGNDVDPFNEASADLNGDGIINVSDVTALINTVLNGSE